MKIAGAMRFLCVLAAVMVAGCAGQGVPEADDEPEAPGDGTMIVRGAVQDDAFQVVPSANVTLVERNLTIQTAPDGTFSFGELPLAFYRVQADAVDLLPQTLTVRPGFNGSLLFTLTRMAEEPSSSSARYAGKFDCAAEYLIIPGSCDAVVTAIADSVEQVEDPELFEKQDLFQHPVHANWKTVVVDVGFDPESMPLLDGLRVTVRGTRDSDDLGTYEQFGRFHGNQSFTFRLEPDQTYTDGVAPVPANATMFEFAVYPHGQGYHATCAASCFLGVGAATDIQFELLVTTFYVEPAPEGFTLL